MKFSALQLDQVTLPLLREAVAVRVGRPPCALFHDGTELSDPTDALCLSALGVPEAAEFIVKFESPATT